MSDQVIQRSFTGGEIAPGLRARADTAMYSNSLAACVNFIVRVQGGAYTRPGTRFIGELDDMSRRARLIPFSFNTEQTYILVFEHNKIRVIKDGGYVIDSASPPDLYEITTTYTESELSRLVFTQDADTMTITIRGHNPAKLSRIDHDDWTLEDIDFSSSVDVPANLAAASVGSGHASETKNYNYVVTAVDAEGIESLPTAEETINIGALTVTGGVRLTWDAVTGAQGYRVYKDPSDGSGVYGWIGDSANNQFDDFNFFPITSDAPPKDNEPFSGTNDKPSCVGYYQQRQIYANTEREPQKAFASQSGIYNSMRYSEPSRDDDAIFFTIKARQVNEIRHIVSLDSLLFLTSGAEWRITDGQDQILTPNTLGAKPQSYWGASWCAPATAGESVIFVQEKGNKIRDLAYEVDSSLYRGNELSVMANHLFEGYQIEEMTYCLEPFAVLWCVRDDGVLLGMTYQREQGVWAWHQHVTDGEVESVASITEDGRDALYMVVKREVEESVVRYVERMEPRTVTSAADVFCVDCGLSYNSSPATTFSGLDHLEGKDVVAVADGNLVTGLTVSGGEIEISNAASKVVVGLPYICRLETLDIDTRDVTQSIRGREMSVSEVQLEVYKSRGGWVSGRKSDGTYTDAYEIKPRFESDGYDAIALKTFKESVTIQADWNRSGGLKIEQRDPFPMAILSIVPTVDIS